MKIYKKWLKYTSSSILALAIMISIFNYKIDSLGLFGNTNYLSKAAKALTNGKMVAGLLNYDERLFQELIVDKLEVSNDIIAIGSSRTMQLRKNNISYKRINFFNHSVSSASIEDYIAITGLYEKKHHYLPKVILLGVDDWVFNKYHFEPKWRSLEKYYFYEMNKINGTKHSNKQPNFLKWKQLINYEYTKENIKFFLHNLQYQDTFYIVDNTNLDIQIKDRDGSLHYPKSIRNKPLIEVKQDARKFVKSEIEYLDKYTKMHSRKKFEKYIEYLQGQGVEIIFYLAPYNPISYDLITGKYNIIEEVELYINHFAKQHNIKIVGSYNPHKYGFSYNDFIDGIHGQDKVIKNIFEKEFKGLD